jgi:hypothetical protein
MLRQFGLAAVVAAIASALIVSVVAAQSPPSPPSRFVGSVTVNGSPAAAGTIVEARIGGTACGVGTVFMNGAEARYTLDSPALDPAQSPACGVDGSTVQFYVGGQLANETGSWANYRLNTVNLTVAPVATTPPTTPGAGTTTTPSRTPGAPVAGDSLTGSSSSSVPMLEVMLVATAIGLAGVGLAARYRGTTRA